MLFIGNAFCMDLDLKYFSSGFLTTDGDLICFYQYNATITSRSRAPQIIITDYLIHIICVIIIIMFDNLQ